VHENPDDQGRTSELRTFPVCLVTTVHDPQNRLAALTRQHLPPLLDLYHSVKLLCSQATSPQAVTLLRELGATAAYGDGPDGSFDIGRKRLQALRLGLMAGAEHLHLCDFDRALHWMATYPDELCQVVAAIPGYDLLVLGRTPRAFETHPPYQTRTEALANHTFGLAYDQEMDITAGSRALSRRTAEYLLAHSQERGVGVDAEWPLLLQRVPGMKVSYRACEGLAMWIEMMTVDPQRWTHRLRMAAEITEATARLAGERK
jgi:hypothetical protein